MFRLIFLSNFLLSFRRMPSGCPEQRFFSFIPNVAAYNYLKAIGKLDKDTEDRTMTHISFGYQELLKIRDTDGSFTVWENKSIWLTACAAKILAHIKTLIYIDPKVILEALNFLTKEQKNGRYTKEEKSTSWAVSALNVNLLEGDALAAYVAIAFLECKDKKVFADFRDFQPTVDSILKNVLERITSIRDSHVMAMFAYAFSLNKNTNETKIWLEDLMNSKKESENKIYWENISKALQVETAAYAIMAYVTIGEYMKAWPIVNWMMSERTLTGAYYTTTDTVLGIQALTMYAEKVYASSTHMSISLSDNGKFVQSFAINSNNALKLQMIDLPVSARNISVSVGGTHDSDNGFAYIQVTKSYNTVVNSTDQFYLTAIPQAGGSAKNLNLRICASFKKIGNKVASKMTLIEVQLPSGYEHDSTNSKELLQLAEVKVSRCSLVPKHKYVLLIV